MLLYGSGMSTFTWRFEAADGTPLPAREDPGSFPSKADAETWVGESWRDLLAQGVEQVSLLRDPQSGDPLLIDGTIEMSGQAFRDPLTGEAAPKLPARVLSGVLSVLRG